MNQPITLAGDRSIPVVGRVRSIGRCTSHNRPSFTERPDDTSGSFVRIRLIQKLSFEPSQENAC